MKKTILASITAMLLTQTAFANDQKQKVEWNNLEIDYIQYNVESVDPLEPKGISIKATKLINDNFFVAASYLHATDKLNNVDVDLEILSLGLGYQHRLSDKSSLYTMVTYENYKKDDLEIDLDLDGYNIAVGFRHLVTPNFELDTRITNEHLEDENLLVLKAKGYYKIENNLSLGLGYNISEGGLGQLETGIRYSF
jgi:hypothetical protein